MLNKMIFLSIFLSSFSFASEVKFSCKAIDGDIVNDLGTFSADAGPEEYKIERKVTTRDGSKRKFMMDYSREISDTGTQNNVLLKFMVIGLNDVIESETIYISNVTNQNGEVRKILVFWNNPAYFYTDASGSQMTVKCDYI